MVFYRYELLPLALFRPARAVPVGDHQYFGSDYDYALCKKRVCAFVRGSVVAAVCFYSFVWGFWMVCADIDE